MAPFPTQGAPMQFERERYPTYVDEDDDAAVVAEQQRVLKAALPITSLQIVCGMMVDYGGIASVLAGAPVEVLVDISAAPELKTMLDAVRQATTPLDIDVFAQWTVARSSEYWLALLYMNLAYGTLVAKFHLAFDLRDSKHRMMLSQIEHVRCMTIDDAAASPVKVYAVAQMRTRTVDLIQGHSCAGLVERMRGLMVEVPTSVINALSHSDYFSLAFKQASSLDMAWPRLKHLDLQLQRMSDGLAIDPPPLDHHEALATSKQLELYLAHCSWFGDPMAVGFGHVQLAIDHGQSAVAKQLRPGWQQLALRGMNAEWLEGYGVATWEILLTWRASSGDPWPLLLEALRLKFDIVTIDLMPMLFFLIQMARSGDLQHAQAWVGFVQMYEVGLLPLVPALVEEWAIVDPERRHHPALAQIDLSDALHDTSTFLRLLLHGMHADLTQIRDSVLEHLDGALLRTFASLASHIWTIEGRGIIGALLNASSPDLPALVGVGMLDALICAAAWLPDPPNPLQQHLVAPPLIPFLWYQYQLIKTDLPPDFGAADMRYLTYDLADNFNVADVPFTRRLLPWFGMEKNDQVDAERAQQITAAIYWLLDQVSRAVAKGTARPAAGRVDIVVPEGFYDLHAYGVERLRILADDDVLLVRLILRQNLGGIVVAWRPSPDVPQCWRMLVPEPVIWQLLLFLASVYRDIRVEGRDEVLISVPRELSNAALPRERSRGRPANALLPRNQIDRIRIGRGQGPVQRGTLYQWTTPEERDYIQRRKHGVKGRTVKLPAHWRASDTQRAVVETLGLPELPEYGMTYRKPHTRGTDTPETIARPIRAKGLLIAMGVLDSLQQTSPRKDDV